MIALSIAGAFLLIIAAILFLPVDAVIKFKDDLFLKIRFSGLNIYELKETESEKPKTADTKKQTGNKPEKENKALNFFNKLKAKYGFSGAVKLLLIFLRDLLPHIKGLLKHIKFKRIVLNITIAEGDAARTAIEYGSVCAVAYPLLAGIESVANVSYKAINISSNFESKETNFDFEGIIRTRIFYLLVALIKVYSEYKKFIVRIENNERK